MTTEQPEAGAPTHDDCTRALQHIHEFLDHEMPERHADDIRAHLDICEQCLDEYDLTHAVKELVHRHCGSAAPEGLRARVLTRLQIIETN
ncbi:mycothiol system anti-sigma-R factor [Propionibacteriaceae bacterium Y2011]